MPTYEVIHPDGRVFELVGDSPPTEAELEEIFASSPSKAPPAPEPEPLDGAQQERGQAVAQTISGLITGMPTQEEADIAERERVARARVPTFRKVGFPGVEQEVLPGQVPRQAVIGPSDATPSQQRGLFREAAGQQERAAERVVSGRLQALATEGAPGFFEAGLEAGRSVFTRAGAMMGGAALGGAPVVRPDVNPSQAAVDYLREKQPTWYANMVRDRTADVQKRSQRVVSDAVQQDASDLYDAFSFIADLAMGDPVLGESGDLATIQRQARDSFAPMAREMGRAMAVDMEVMAQDPAAYAAAEPIDTAITVASLGAVPAVKGAFSALKKAGQVPGSVSRGLLKANQALKKAKAERKIGKVDKTIEELAEEVKDTVDAVEQHQIDETARLAREAERAQETQEALDNAKGATPGLADEIEDASAAPNLPKFSQREVLSKAQAINRRAEPEPKIKETGDGEELFWHEWKYKGQYHDDPADPKYIIPDKGVLSHSGGDVYEGTFDKAGRLFDGKHTDSKGVVTEYRSGVAVVPDRPGVPAATVEPSPTTARIRGKVVRGAKHEATKAMRQLLGLPKGNASTPATRTLTQALDNAQDLVTLGSVALPDGSSVNTFVPKPKLLDALDEARRGERILTDRQQFAATLVAYAREKDLDIARTNYAEAMRKQTADAEKQVMPHAAVGKARKNVDKDHMQKVEEAEAALDEVFSALEVSGSEWGRAGRARQAYVSMFEDMTDAQAVNLATVQKGGKLTPDEAEKVKTKFNDAKERKTKAQERIEKLDDTIVELDEAEDRALVLAIPDKQKQKIVNEIKKKRKRAKRAQTDASREAAIANAEMNAAANLGWIARATDALNMSRAIQASLDLSAFGRQGIKLFKAHPILGTKAAIEMFKSIRNPDYAADLQRKLVQSPVGQYGDKSGLFTTDVEGVRGTGVNKREEMFVNNALAGGGLVSRGAGKILRFSERTYATMLNQLRIMIFDNWTRVDGGAFWMKSLLPDDVGVVQTADGVRRVGADDAAALARIINIATGRGDLVEQILPARAAGPVNSILGKVFFAPKFAAATFQEPLQQAWDLLAPGKSQVVKARQFERLIKEQAANLGILVTANATMSDKPWDEAMADFFNPDSPDFLALSIPQEDGSRRIIDMSGGGASMWRYLPLLSILQDTDKSGVGEVTSPEMNRLIRNKLVGPLGAVYTILTNRGFRGQELAKEGDDILNQVAQRVVLPVVSLGVPINVATLIGDAVNYVQAKDYSEQESKDVVGHALELFGFSNYIRKPKKGQQRYR